MTILIRQSQPSDIIPLTEIYNHYICNTAITFDLEPYSIEERTQKWFSHYSSKGRYRLFVAQEQDVIVGYATSSRFLAKAAYETSVETSIYLQPCSTGKGLGRQLYTALFEALSSEDIHRAYAGITLPNPVSIRFHQQFGFRSVGIYREVGRKFNQYWNVEWFEKCLPQLTKNEQEF